MALLRLRVTLLCAALLLGELRAQSPRGVPGGGGGTGEYGVRLCGREFIRAVIFTCGGSRWKRLSMLEEEESGERRRDSPSYRRRDVMQDSTNKELNQLKLQSLFGSHMEQLPKADFPLRQQTLKDYFNIHEYDEDYTPTFHDFNEYVRQVEDTAQTARSGSEVNAPVESSEFPWVKYPRRRREMSTGVAGICCKWGCTKTEISTLC